MNLNKIYICLTIGTLVQAQDFIEMDLEDELPTKISVKKAESKIVSSKAQSLAKWVSVTLQGIFFTENQKGWIWLNGQEFPFSSDLPTEIQLDGKTITLHSVTAFQINVSFQGKTFDLSLGQSVKLGSGVF